MRGGGVIHTVADHEPVDDDVTIDHASLSMPQSNAEDDAELTLYLGRMDVGDWAEASSGWMPLRSPPVLCLVLLLVDQEPETLLHLRLVSRTFQAAVDRLPGWRSRLPSYRLLQWTAYHETLRRCGGTPPSEQGWNTPTEDGLTPVSECSDTHPSHHPVPPASPSAADRAVLCSQGLCAHHPRDMASLRAYVASVTIKVEDSLPSQRRRSTLRGLASCLLGTFGWLSCVAIALGAGSQAVYSYTAILVFFPLFLVAPCLLATTMFLCNARRSKSRSLLVLPQVAVGSSAVVFGTLAMMLMGHFEGSRQLAYDAAPVFDLRDAVTVSEALASETIAAVLRTIVRDGEEFVAVRPSDSDQLVLPSAIVFNASATAEVPTRALSGTSDAAVVSSSLSDVLWGSTSTLRSGDARKSAQLPFAALSVSVMFIEHRNMTAASGSAGWPIAAWDKSDPATVSMFDPTTAQRNTEAVNANGSKLMVAKDSFWITPLPCESNPSQERRCVDSPARYRTGDLSASEAHSRLSFAATYHVVRLQSWRHPCLCRVVRRAKPVEGEPQRPPRLLLSQSFQCVPQMTVGPMAADTFVNRTTPVLPLPVDPDPLATRCLSNQSRCSSRWPAMADYGLVCATWGAGRVGTPKRPAEVTPPFVIRSPAADMSPASDFASRTAVLVELEASEVARRIRSPAAGGTTVRAVRLPMGTFIEVDCAQSSWWTALRYRAYLPAPPYRPGGAANLTNGAPLVYVTIPITVVAISSLTPFWDGMPASVIQPANPDVLGVREFWPRSSDAILSSRRGQDPVECASNVEMGLALAEIVAPEGLTLATAFQVPVFGSVHDPAMLADLTSRRGTYAEDVVLVAQPGQLFSPYPIVDADGMRILHETVYKPALVSVVTLWALVMLPSVVWFPLSRRRCFARRLSAIWHKGLTLPILGPLGVGVSSFCVVRTEGSDVYATSQPLVCLTTDGTMVLVCVLCSIVTMLQLRITIASLWAQF